MELKTKQGKLTPYAFACGYVENQSRGNITTKIYMEHTVYHVYVMDSYQDNKRIGWKAFPTLGEARRYARAQRGTYTPSKL